MNLSSSYAVWLTLLFRSRLSTNDIVPPDLMYLHRQGDALTLHRAEGVVVSIVADKIGTATEGEHAHDGHRMPWQAGDLVSWNRVALSCGRHIWFPAILAGNVLLINGLKWELPARLAGWFVASPRLASVQLRPYLVRTKASTCLCVSGDEVSCLSVTAVLSRLCRWSQAHAAPSRRY